MSEQMIVNDNLFRLRMGRLLGLTDERDIDKECGYPEMITAADYHYLFRREGFATRMISIFPEECWSDDPKVYETEDEEQTTAFEEEFELLVKEHRLWNYLQRADTMSGIGRFGIIVLGINDGKQPSEPVEGSDDGKLGAPKKGTELIYIKVYDESCVTVSKWNDDALSPRYGLPVEYNVQVISYRNGEAAPDDKTSMKVHWSRAIHIADGRNTSDILGTPRLESVFNRTYDIRKVAGGSGEMFWKGAFPGFATEVDPDAELDSKEAKEEIKKYQEGMSRILALKGIKVNQLKPQVVDPTPHLKAMIMLSAASKGIPYRILMGTEEAKLAGSEDAKAWARRCHRRNLQYVGPFIVREVVDRFINLGILTAPAKQNGYTVGWDDPGNMSEMDHAKVSEMRTKALALYMTSGLESLVPFAEFASCILKMSTAEIKQIIKARDSQDLDDVVDEDELEQEEE